MKHAMNTPRWCIGWLLALATTCTPILSGCSNNSKVDEPLSAKQVRQQESDALVSKIKSDPRIPADQKQKAIDAVKKRYAEQEPGGAAK